MSMFVWFGICYSSTSSHRYGLFLLIILQKKLLCKPLTTLNTCFSINLVRVASYKKSTGFGAVFLELWFVKHIPQKHLVFSLTMYIFWELHFRFFKIRISGYEAWESEIVNNVPGWYLEHISVWEPTLHWDHTSAWLGTLDTAWMESESPIVLLGIC